MSEQASAGPAAPFDTTPLARLLDGLGALAAGRSGDARYRFRQVVDGADDRLGEDRSAEAWAATGRLARQQGRREEAREDLARARSQYEERRHYAGQAEVLLEHAALTRREDPAGALRALDVAASMARDEGRGHLLARIHLGRASVLAEPDTIVDALDTALRHAMAVRDRALVGLALVELGRQGREGAEEALLAGAQLLLDAGHYPGFGLALLRVGHHALAQDDLDLAMASAEGAWRVYRAVDPEAGLARVLELAERALLLADAPARSAWWCTPVRPCSVSRRRWWRCSAGCSGRPAPTSAPRCCPWGRWRCDRRPDGASSSRSCPPSAGSGSSPPPSPRPRGPSTCSACSPASRPGPPHEPLADLQDVETPESMPEATLPEHEDLEFVPRTTLRVSVPSASAATRAPTMRSSVVYDPDGRLASMVSASLDYARDMAPDEAGDDGSLSERTALFPEDDGDATFLGGGADSPEHDAFWSDLGLGADDTDPEAPSVAGEDDAVPEDADPFPEDADPFPEDADPFDEGGPDPFGLPGPGALGPSSKD